MRRYCIQKPADDKSGGLPYVLLRSDRWACLLVRYEDAKLFTDRDAADQFVIQAHLLQPSKGWLDATVVEKDLAV